MQKYKILNLFNNFQLNQLQISLSRIPKVAPTKCNEPVIKTLQFVVDLSSLMEFKACSMVSNTKISFFRWFKISLEKFSQIFWCFWHRSSWMFRDNLWKLSSFRFFIATIVGEFVVKKTLLKFSGCKILNISSEFRSPMEL